MHNVWWEILPRDERTSSEIVRGAWARAANVDPEQVDVARWCPVCCGDDHGRFDPWRGWHASISHAGEWVAVCVGFGVRVGIDIEHVGRLTPSLADDIRHTDDPAVPLDELWVHKEAYLKALGWGLLQPMATVNLAGLPSGHRTMPAEAPVGYLGAVAVVA